LTGRPYGLTLAGENQKHHMPAPQEDQARNREAHHAPLAFYIPDPIPSASELTGLLTLFQGVICWSALMKIPHRHSYRGDEPVPLSIELMHSYRGFLQRKYELPILYGASSVALAADRVEKGASREGHDVRSMIDGFIRTRALPLLDGSGTDVDLLDLVEWSGEYFGRRYLPLERIDPSGSLEIVFDLVPFLAIMSLTAHPGASELVTHCCNILNRYIGKQTGPAKVPVLPSWLRDVIVQYDDVTIENRPHGGLRIRLKR